MGVDTRAYIPNLTLPIILKFMKIYDKGARLEEVKLYKGEMFYIHFLDRMMTLHISNTDMKKAKAIADKEGWNIEDTDQYLAVKEDGFPPNTHGLSLKLGHDEQAVKVMRLICLVFGGYMKAEDTASGPYYKIKQNRRMAIKVVLSETQI